jgi:hypothetical protein
MMRHHLYRAFRLAIILAGLSLLLTRLTEPADAAEAPPGGTGTANTIGVVVGVPQTVAVTYGRLLSPRIRLSLYAGSAVLFHAAGIRAQITARRGRFRPYGFAGYALIYSVGEDYGDPTGTSGYLWLGPGARLVARRWALFAEVCALLGGDEDRGLGHGPWIFPFSPALAGGLEFRF